MSELKTVVVETSAKVAELKKRESELAESRNTLKTHILGLIDSHVLELREIGFDYVLSEKEASATGGKSHACSRCKKPGHTKATCPEVKK